MLPGDSRGLGGPPWPRGWRCAGGRFGDPLTVCLGVPPQPACLMPQRERRAPRWRSGVEAPRRVHTCLWLSAACIPLVLSHGLAPGPQPGADGRATPRGHGELAWAVSLDVPEEELEQRAEELARTAGLVNMGRIGELKGHYLFAYRPHGPTAPGHEAIRSWVDTLFAQHDSVRWHSEQKLLKRSKRSLHFNDPKYPQQWHLVSGFPAPVPPVISGPLCGYTPAVTWRAKRRLCLLAAGRKRAGSSPCPPPAHRDNRRRQHPAQRWPRAASTLLSVLSEPLVSGTPSPALAPCFVARALERSRSPCPWGRPAALPVLCSHCPFWCLEQPQEPREGHQRHRRVGAERDGARCDSGGGGRRCGAHHQRHTAKLRECRLCRGMGRGTDGQQAAGHRDVAHPGLQRATAQQGLARGVVPGLARGFAPELQGYQHLYSCAPLVGGGLDVGAGFCLPHSSC